MAKSCVYCKTPLTEEALIDVCERCGHGVWGAKMFQAIKDGAKQANESGNLYQGSVGTR